MKPLSPSMADTLLAAPSEWNECPTHLTRETTRIALESRGLVDFEYRRYETTYGRVRDRLFWRRTRVGEDLALDISLQREREGAAA